MQLLKLFVCFETVHKLFSCYRTHLHFIYTITLQCLGCCVKSQVVFIWLWVHHEGRFEEIAYINPRELREQSNQPSNLSVLRFFFKIIPLLSQLKWFIHSSTRHSQPSVIYLFLEFSQTKT